MRLRHFIGQGKFEAIKLIWLALATDNLQFTISKKQKNFHSLLLVVNLLKCLFKTLYRR